MPPKKKNNKKADDWESELGESIAPNANGNSDAAAAAADGEEEAAEGGGGLMNLMRKNKEKRKKKGLSEDYVAGEDPPDTAGAGDDAPVAEMFTQPPQEANLDDEFAALPEKKAKGGAKGKQQAQAKGKAAAEEETGADGRVLTKAEKEKLKKEREKQRKKEQVSSSHDLPLSIFFSGKI